MANIVKLPYCEDLESLNEFLNNFDCNNTLSIVSGYDLPKVYILCHLEKYITNYSVKIITDPEILLSVHTIYKLDFLKNLVDNQLLELSTEVDLTEIFIDQYNYTSTIDIIKWYYYSGWKFNYNCASVFGYVITYESFDAFKWWYENNLTRDYSDSILSIALTYTFGKHLSEFLDIILEDHVVSCIDYFNYMRFAIEAKYDIREDIINTPCLNDIIKVTDFCIYHGANFKISHIVNYGLDMLVYTKNMNQVIHDLFEYYIFQTLTERKLTNNELKELYYYYVFECDANVVSNYILDHIENILELPIKIDLKNNNINNIHFGWCVLSENIVKNKSRFNDLIDIDKVCIIDNNLLLN